MKSTDILDTAGWRAVKLGASKRGPVLQWSAALDWVGCCVARKRAVDCRLRGAENRDRRIDHGKRAVSSHRSPKVPAAQEIVVIHDY